MIRVLLVSSLVLSVLSVAMDKYFLNTIHVQITKAQMSCKNTNLTINGKLYSSANSECQADGSTLLLASADFPALEKNSVPVELIAIQSVKTVNTSSTYSYSLTGMLYLNEKFDANTPQSTNASLTGNVTINTIPIVRTTPIPRTKKPTTTRKPTTPKHTTVKTTRPSQILETIIDVVESEIGNSTAVLTINWIHIKFDEDKKSSRGTGGSVAFVIICILTSYFL